jgi:hypothetical protein
MSNSERAPILSASRKTPDEVLDAAMALASARFAA